jgi:hypothetical protein
MRGERLRYLPQRLPLSVQLAHQRDHFRHPLTAGPDLGLRRSSRLVATASENRLKARSKSASGIGFRNANLINLLTWRNH